MRISCYKFLIRQFYENIIPNCFFFATRIGYFEIINFIGEKEGEGCIYNCAHETKRNTNEVYNQHSTTFRICAILHIQATISTVTHSQRQVFLFLSFYQVAGDRLNGNHVTIVDKKREKQNSSFFISFHLLNGENFRVSYSASILNLYFFSWRKRRRLQVTCLDFHFDPFHMKITLMENIWNDFRASEKAHDALSDLHPSFMWTSITGWKLLRAGS